ncbi:hypothetical protein ING2D1G_0693 [Peptoniphilus sp. ING2-D1G]|nr:hypothetical protein ING2D1G_0693 [Peptoniphilus sp. ING2-D1G]
MTVKELIEELEKYDENLEVKAEIIIDDREYLMQVMSFDEGIETLYLELEELF